MPEPEVRLCIYPRCARWVELIEEPAPPWGGRPRKIQPAHDIEHDLLTGPCPASLQPVGWHRGETAPLAVLTMLTERDRVDREKLVGLAIEQAKAQYRADKYKTKGEPESRTLRQPSRIGREPDPDAEDWQLGGREDEDSGHVQEYAVKPPKVPAGVVGQEIGRHVTSIDELIGMTQEAALKGGEARAALLDASNQMSVAQGSIEQAIDVIAQIQGQATSALIESYRAIFAQVQTDIASLIEQNESIIEAIGAGQEKGEEFIGRLLS